jgi:hypothetical protein
VIGYISKENRLKLIKSIGFCPHRFFSLAINDDLVFRRCQLYNLSGTGPSNICPPGLCYTKIEVRKLTLDYLDSGRMDDYHLVHAVLKMVHTSTV